MHYEPEDRRLMYLHESRIIQRDIDQLLGICEMCLQDGVIDQNEAESILTWLEAHGECLDTWPANVLYERLRGVLADGVLDDDEQRDLLGLILRIAQPRGEDGLVVPARLPLNDPPPKIVMPNRAFCFTGVFDFGSRAQCHEAVTQRGGDCLKGITKKLHYLVIGNIGSEVWRHSSFGSKIAKAVEYRDNGFPLAVVTERHWTAALAE